MRSKKVAPVVSGKRKKGSRAPRPRVPGYLFPEHEQKATVFEEPLDGTIPRAPPIRQANGRSLPGRPILGSGKREGTRTKFAARFIADVYDHWCEEGMLALRRVFTKSPDKYLAIVHKLVPAEFKIEEHSNLAELSDEQLRAIVQLAALARSNDPERVAKLLAARRDGSDAVVVEESVVESTEDVPAVSETSGLSWSREDLEREIAARGQPARQDPRGRNGNGHAPDGPLSGVVDRADLRSGD
jgi:hypothetical protein